MHCNASIQWPLAKDCTRLWRNSPSGQMTAVKFNYIAILLLPRCCSLKQHAASSVNCNKTHQSTEMQFDLSSRKLKVLQCNVSAKQLQPIQCIHNIVWYTVHWSCNVFSSKAIATGGSRWVSASHFKVYWDAVLRCTEMQPKWVDAVESVHPTLLSHSVQSAVYYMRCILYSVYSV